MEAVRLGPGMVLAVEQLAGGADPGVADQRAAPRGRFGTSGLEAGLAADAWFVRSEKTMLWTCGPGRPCGPSDARGRPPPSAAA
jgi:hypothetical protein